jgi:hypothetical protein
LTGTASAGAATVDFKWIGSSFDGLGITPTSLSSMSPRYRDFSRPPRSSERVSLPNLRGRDAQFDLNMQHNTAIVRLDYLSLRDRSAVPMAAV